jgi:HlyD family secretion protein
VLRVAQPSEASVPLGAPLLELGDTQRLEVVAELLTADALQAKPGSRVVIERWGGAELQGQVRLVEPAAFTKVSALGVEEQRVKVLIDITSPGEQWRALGDGYRVGVRVVTLVRDDAVKVPVSAVFPLPDRDDGPGGMAVFELRDRRAHLTPVGIGARNGTDAWVREGLAPGASVIVYPPSSVRDGTRVEVRSVSSAR